MSHVINDTTPAYNIVPTSMQWSIVILTDSPSAEMRVKAQLWAFTTEVKKLNSNWTPTFLVGVVDLCFLNYFESLRNLNLLNSKDFESWKIRPSHRRCARQIFLGRGASDHGAGQRGTQQLSIHIPQRWVSILGIITWMGFEKQVKQKPTEGRGKAANKSIVVESIFEVSQGICEYEVSTPWHIIIRNIQQIVSLSLESIAVFPKLGSGFFLKEGKPFSFSLKSM